MLKGLLIFLGLAAAGIVIGGFVADNLLRQNLGLSLSDVLNYVFLSSETLEGSRSISELGSVSPETDEFVSGLINEKDSMEETLGLLSDFVGVFNNNTSLTQGLKEAFGERYTIYLFTVATIMNESFKVFEWSIELTDGSITSFESGMLFDEYNVIMQMDQSIASTVLSGPSEIGLETIVPWIKNGLIKIKPLTEIMRVTALLPQVFSGLSDQE